MTLTTTARPANRLQRKRVVLDIVGVSHSTLYAQIAEGLFVPPVKCGERASAWPEHETDAIVAARISGKTKVEIKALVQKLIAQRQTAGEA